MLTFAIGLPLALIIMIAITLFHLVKLRNIERFDRGLFALHRCQRLVFHLFTNNFERLTKCEFVALQRIGLLMEALIEEYRAGKGVTYSDCERLKEAFEGALLNEGCHLLCHWLRLILEICDSRFRSMDDLER